MFRESFIEIEEPNVHSVISFLENTLGLEFTENVAESNLGFSIRVEVIEFNKDDFETLLSNLDSDLLKTIEEQDYYHHSTKDYEFKLELEFNSSNPIIGSHLIPITDYLAKLLSSKFECTTCGKFRSLLGDITPINLYSKGNVVVNFSVDEPNSWKGSLWHYKNP